MAADDRVAAQEVLLGVEEVHRAPLALGAARRLAEQLGHARAWSIHAAGQGVAVVAVGGDDVIVVAEHADRTDGHRLLAAVLVEEAADRPLLVHHLRPLFEPADQQHLSQPSERLVARDQRLGFGLHLRHLDGLLGDSWAGRPPMVIAGRRGGLGRAGDADEAARGSSRGQGSGSPGPDGFPDIPGEPCEHPCSLNGRRRGRRRTSIPPGRLYKKTVSRSRRRPSRPGRGRREAPPRSTGTRGVSTRVRSARCRCGSRRRRRLRRVPAPRPCRRSAAGGRTAESHRSDNSGSLAACRSGPWR